MKKIILAIVAFSIVSCGSQNADDKVAKLEKLRSQYNDLSAQIALLEEELVAEGVIKKESKTVQIQNFAPQKFQRVVTVQGIVDGDEIISINPTASGEIVELNVKVGQTVKKDQIMARIDDKVLKKTMKELKTALDLATTLYKKQAALWRDSIGSEIQYIQAKNTKESLEAKIASLEEQMELYILRAPIDANVDMVNLRMGQIASPQMVGVVLVNFEKLKVKANVSESYSAIVQKGQTIDVEFPDLDKTLPLTITAVSNYIDPKNRSFTVEADLPKVSDVKANMLAKMGLVTYTNDNAIAIPINVIQKSGNEHFVWVVQNGNVANRIPVQIGVVAENVIEIISGITPQDNIITVGYQDLTEGQTVQIQEN